MKIISILTLALALIASIDANELFTKVHTDKEEADGVFSDLWRLTIAPTDGQLVLATYWIDVDETLDTTGLPNSKKIETFYYVPGKLFSKDVGYAKVFNSERKIGDEQFYKKWTVSGFGQQVKLGPMVLEGSGGGSGKTKISAIKYHQSVRRRFRFVDQEEATTQKLVIGFQLETVEIDGARAKATKAGIKLPERQQKSWSITLPQETRRVEQDGADQPSTAPESKPEGKENPQPESEGRPQ